MYLAGELDKCSDQMFTDEEDEESTNEDNSDSEAIEDNEERRAHRRLRGGTTRGLKLPPGLSARVSFCHSSQFSF